MTPPVTATFLSQLRGLAAEWTARHLHGYRDTQVGMGRCEAFGECASALESIIEKAEGEAPRVIGHDMTGAPMFDDCEGCVLLGRFLAGEPISTGGVAGPREWHTCYRREPKPKRFGFECPHCKRVEWTDDAAQPPPGWRWGSTSHELGHGIPMAYCPDWDGTTRAARTP